MQYIRHHAQCVCMFLYLLYYFSFKLILPLSKAHPKNYKNVHFSIKAFKILRTCAQSTLMILFLWRFSIKFKSYTLYSL